MKKYKAYHYADYPIPLKPHSRYPIEKFAKFVTAATSYPQLEVLAAQRETRATALVAHDALFVDAVLEGTLSTNAEREMGFPWSAALVERGLRILGATKSAVSHALVDGLGFCLGGGAHHSFADRGRGFCVFNDIAVAARLLHKQQPGMRIAIIDLDVHQGDGTASILAGDSQILTASLHAKDNYPFEKQNSDVDIALESGAGDAQYLTQLERLLEEVLAWGRPDFVIYLAGADAYEEDTLGKLMVSAEGMRLRDRALFSFCAERNAPVCVVFGGGYCQPIDKTIEIYCQTIEEALAACCVKQEVATPLVQI